MANKVVCDLLLIMSGVGKLVLVRWINCCEYVRDLSFAGDQVPGVAVTKSLT